MRWYDGLAIVLFALAAMGAWMVNLVQNDKKIWWLAWTAALAPVCFYVVARSGGSAEAALAAGILGGPALAAWIAFVPRLRDVVANWLDGEP
ncbi:hypothetical protein [Caulobacter sp.]|uniref:hypothetical protein n=1 Tax=Caulobacter sp. TaxID=78 RepID=UPI001B2D2898|nr:hypothetical protein [Caulobacter sp.]MBO9547683.1 hypothetical protein [Caulobacter sp.]